MSNLEEMLTELAPSQSRRLTFQEKCAAYYALKRGFPQKLIGKVFGVSQGAACALLKASPDSRRYRDVAHEFERLGAEEFGRRYWTPEYDDRLGRFRMGQQKTFDQMRGSAPNPTADKYQGAHESADGEFHINWVPGKGWIWLAGNMPAEEQRPYRSSTAAYDAYWEFAQLPNPRKE
jgi:hypothetical protein